MDLLSIHFHMPSYTGPLFIAIKKKFHKFASLFDNLQAKTLTNVANFPLFMNMHIYFHT